MNKISVSIIIAVFNDEKYICKCLESFNDQTYNNFEIIIVNDGSNDNTSVQIKNIIPELKLSNKKYFERPHLGPAKARNFGVKNAKGKILVFIDADMFFEKNFLEKLVSPIIENKCKGTYSTEEYVANWENCWARCWNYNWNLPNRRRIDNHRADQQKDFRAILKEEFVKVNGYDDTGYTDTWTLSQKLGYYPTAVKAEYYHFNPSTVSEVYHQAKWVSKRDYKFGFIGKLFAIFRANPVFSLIIGVRQSVLKKELNFTIFKLIYDFGMIAGLLGF